MDRVMFDSNSYAAILVLNLKNIYEELIALQAKGKIQVYGLDIVISDDKASMLNTYARKSYEIVNRAAGLSTPNLISLKKFTEWLMRLK